MPGTRASWQERFWRFVTPGRPDECWEWQGSRDQHGYGRLNVEGRVLKAHRASYLLAHGELPPVVRHRCDNPPCVNPAHLLAGTMKDNTGDMLARGRESRQSGADNPRTKLPDTTVVAIRDRAAAGASDAQVAREFGLTEKYACALITGQRRAAAGGPIRQPDDTRGQARERALRYMRDAGRPISARELDALGMAGRTVLQGMQRRGLVRRIPPTGGNPRAVVWELSEARP